MKIIIDTTKNIIPRILLLSIFILVFLSVIAYARGYRFSFEEGKVTSTGILSINSNPRAAKVYVNDELRGATDTNLTLPYGQYSVRVTKEGYTSWEKEVSLKGEIVMSLNALLFSKNPSLTPLTNLGISKAVPVGNTDRIILVSQTGNIERDGLYLFESNTQPLTIFPPLKNILLASLLPPDIDLRTAEFVFDPNERRAIVTFTTTVTEETIEEPLEVSYLIALDEQNAELFEVTSSKENILQAWNEDKNREIHKIIETLPAPIQKVASESFHIVSLSPDEKKLMYLAKDEATIPMVIDPPLIGANQSTEERTLEEGGLYIYDKKEDKNFRIPVELNVTIPSPTASPTPVVTQLEEQTITPTPTLPHLIHEELTTQIRDQVQWYPTSDYVVVKEEERIVLMQYDGGNRETVYAGPFDPGFFGISPDWNLLVILNLNPQINESGDLYSVGIR